MLPDHLQGVQVCLYRASPKSWHIRGNGIIGETSEPSIVIPVNDNVLWVRSPPDDPLPVNQRQSLLNLSNPLPLPRERHCGVDRRTVRAVVQHLIEVHLLPDDRGEKEPNDAVSVCDDPYSKVLGST